MEQVLYEFDVVVKLLVPVEKQLDSQAIIAEHLMITEGRKKITDLLYENFKIGQTKSGDVKFSIKSHYYFDGKKIPVICY
jgi:hypothetical protein